MGSTKKVTPASSLGSYSAAPSGLTTGERRGRHILGKYFRKTHSRVRDFMREISVETNQLPRTDHSCPERLHHPLEEESARCWEFSETIAEFTLRAGGRKMTVAMCAQGDVTSRMETCSPGQLSPDQWAQLCDVLLLAAHSMISMDHPEDGR